MVSAIANAVMVVVWAVYLQLIYRSHLYQRRPRILINVGLDGRFRLSNMSQEAIYLQCMQAVLRSQDAQVVAELTDLGDGSALKTDQGTMASGSSATLGSLESLLQAVQQRRPPLDGGALCELELRVVAIYGSEERPVGASRRFAIRERQDRLEVTPVELQSCEYSSSAERDEVESWLRDCLDDAKVSVPRQVLSRVRPG